MSSQFLYIPLGVFGLTRWAAWLVHRIPATLYRPIVNGHRDSLAVVTPVYQEDPDIFREAVESWLRNDVDEIIAVIDVTDDACTAVAQAYDIEVILTDVPGKRDALRRGWEAAGTSLVALVDSDTIWADDVGAQVCEPFLDPKVGGVGPRQNTLNPTGFWQDIADMYLDYRYFDELAAQSVIGQSLSCLSGRTAVYRRTLLLEVGDEFMNETFMGRQCLSGDDKRLTMLIIRAGHKTVLQRNARVWSTFPSSFMKFLKQRTRWARNTWRSDLRAIGGLWVFRHPMLAFIILNKMVSPFALLFSFGFLIYLLTGHAWLAAATIVAWWLVSRAAKLLPHFRRRPDNLRLLPAFIAVSIFMAAVKIYALLTIRTQLWLTRDVGVVDGAIQRTGAAGVE
jgi:cellulose synthase/poly-beta-1,6-N-acetylglucosamine synthase-like glycosyltransferase